MATAKGRRTSKGKNGKNSSGKTNRRTVNKRTARTSHTAEGILLLALIALTAFGVITTSNAFVLVWLRRVISGACGYLRFPALLLGAWFSVRIMGKGARTKWTMWTLSAAACWTFGTLLQVFSMDRALMQLRAEGYPEFYWNAISISYIASTNMPLGGGFLGALLGYPLHELLDVLGSVLLLSAALAVELVLIVRQIHPDAGEAVSAWFSGAIGRIGEMREERRSERTDAAILTEIPQELLEAEDERQTSGKRIPSRKSNFGKQSVPDNTVRSAGVRPSAYPVRTEQTVRSVQKTAVRTYSGTPARRSPTLYIEDIIAEPDMKDSRYTSGESARRRENRHGRELSSLSWIFQRHPERDTRYNPTAGDTEPELQDFTQLRYTESDTGVQEDISNFPAVNETEEISEVQQINDESSQEWITDTPEQEQPEDSLRFRRIRTQEHPRKITAEVESIRPTVRETSTEYHEEVLEPNPDPKGKPDPDIPEETTEEPVRRRARRSSHQAENTPAVSVQQSPPQTSKDVQSRTYEPELKKSDSKPAKELYEYPPVELLEQADIRETPDTRAADTRGAEKLIRTLDSFGVKAQVTGVVHGPAITRYEIQPAPGVKVSRIVSLVDDIALNMAAVGVRIEAPIPGKAAVGIEIANSEIATVHLRDVLEGEEFRRHKSMLAVALGKDIAGKRIIADLAKMPHLLIAGATGSGKSVCINTIIVSLIYRATPDEVRLILIDPKKVELSVYNGIPHLLVPVVTDPKKASGALNWAVTEMDERYRRFAELNVRDIRGYNERRPEGTPFMPSIVVIIDELSDLMMVAPGEVEESIIRLAQLARACGIHLVIATQRPSVNVITGIIKANIPSRIAFAVSSQVDSRTILDAAGAEKLLGKGDMLFAPAGAGKPTRVQGCFVSDGDVSKVVEYVKDRSTTDYSEAVIAALEAEPDEKESIADQDTNDADTDELLEQAVEMAVESGQASISMLQRRLRVGYARAGRLIDEMAKRGIIGQAEGAKPRQVLITREEMLMMFPKR